MTSHNSYKNLLGGSLVQFIISFVHHMQAVTEIKNLNQKTYDLNNKLFFTFKCGRFVIQQGLL